MSKQKFVIAIDGPVASGKGTVAVKLAKDLHGLYLYTGAMYRSVALVALTKDIDLTDEKSVISILPQVVVSFEGDRVMLTDKDVTERIKEQDTANGASVVGVYPKVRESMVHMQQVIANKALADGQIVVTEGRDTGTRVFPDAQMKIYLTATNAVRAQRRLAQYQQKGIETTFEKVLEEIQKRDKRDTTRETDPLPNNPEELGYFILDDSLLSEEETEQAIHKELQGRGLL